MTLPADKTGNPCMSGPRPATPFTETSSSGFPRHSNLGRFFCTISNLLFFFIFTEQTGERVLVVEGSGR